MQNMKFHMMAMGGMITAAIVVFILVSLSKESDVQPVADTGAEGRQIYIHSASWGLNCNPIIELKRKDNIRMGMPTDKLVPVEQNNVLEVVKKLCEGKLTCSINIIPEVLLEDNYPRCNKALNLSYRCFSYDSVTSVTGAQGESMTIDCRTTPQ